jgi:hypothetical protein
MVWEVPIRIEPNNRQIGPVARIARWRLSLIQKRRDSPRLSDADVAPSTLTGHYVIFQKYTDILALFYLESIHEII